jgi:hypothetical protein
MESPFGINSREKANVLEILGDAKYLGPVPVKAPNTPLD